MKVILKAENGVCEDKIMITSYLDKKKSLRIDGTTSTIVCRLEKSYLAGASAAAGATTAVVSTTAAVSIAGAAVSIAGAAVESAGAAESEPPHEARAAIATITNNFFILNFFC